MNSSRLRNGFVYLLILLAIGAILYSYRSQSVRPDSATITDVAEALKGNTGADRGRSIKGIKVSGDRLTVLFQDGSTAVAQKESDIGAKEELQALGDQAHIYTGTCLGDFALQHRISLDLDRAQRRWSRFWCRPEHNPKLADYRSSEDATRARLRQELDLQVALGPDHVGHRDAVCDADDEIEVCLGRLHDGVGRERRRHVYNAGVGPGGFLGLGHRSEDRQLDVVRIGPAGHSRVVGFARELLGGTGLGGMDCTDHLSAVCDGLVGMEAPGAA